MPLEFTCPHCQARTVVDEEYLGLSGPCFQCGKTVSVPLKPTASAATDVRRRERERRLWRVSLTLLLAGLLLGGGGMMIASTLLQPVAQAARDWTQRQSCEDNLRRIATALSVYHDRYGRFPPAYLTGPDGKPAHSWRVLILPQLGEQSLYAQYRFDEPWDGPNNSLLHLRMPAVYGCPADPMVVARTDTSYLAVIGKLTAMDTNAGRSRDSILDGPENTLLVVESHESGIGWLEPRDLPVNALAKGINGIGKLTARSEHMNGAYAITADGKVHLLRDTTPTETLEAMATVNSGEVVQGLDGR
jgi:hypothetical protein